MNIRRITAWAIGALIIALTAVIGAFFDFDSGKVARPETETSEMVFFRMGTFCSLAFYGTPLENEQAIRIVGDALDEVELACSLFASDSELRKLNQTAASEPFVCSERLWSVLGAARRAWRNSGGAFDVTAKPLMDLWGFYRKRGEEAPSEKEIAETLLRVGLDKVRFDDQAQAVFFTVPGMAIDLGGIAKGYAVDLAATRLSRAGISCGMINLGGNIRVLNEPPPGLERYRVGVRDPLSPDALARYSLAMLDQSVATSGSYEKFVTLRGKRYSHIMNPATGMPVGGMLAVTVITPLALDADLLSTTLFVRGPQWAAAHREILPSGTRAIFYLEHGETLEIRSSEASADDGVAGE